MFTLRQWKECIKPVEYLLYNCSVTDGSDGWISCPIGMGYPFVHHRDDDMTQYQLGAHDKTVLCALCAGTDVRRRPNPKNRESILKTLLSNGINNTILPPPEYFKTLPQYKYVISPEGNGLDCHRHYEAFMAGCIPIMERNDLVCEKYKTCPVLWTDDYSEVTEAYLESKYNEYLDKTYDFSPLLMPAYDKDSQNVIRLNGNFWAATLTGKLWYC